MNKVNVTLNLSAETSQWVNYLGGDGIEGILKFLLQKEQMGELAITRKGIIELF